MAHERPSSIWLRPERTGRGPVPEHDRARIAAAAVTLADADGLGAVSMRKIAAALGTAPASLYRYVDSRDELLELMADAAAGELDLTRPLSGDWQADLVALAHQMHGIYRRHPWLLDLVPGHTSDRHPWFLAAPSGSARERSTSWSTPSLLWPNWTSRAQPSWKRWRC